MGKASQPAMKKSSGAPKKKPAAAAQKRVSKKDTASLKKCGRPCDSCNEGKKCVTPG